MAAVLSEGDVSLEDITLRSLGKKIRTSAAKQIMDFFCAPEYGILHWDGRLVPELHNKILASGMPNCNGGKLLCVPVITSSSGEQQAKAGFEQPVLHVLWSNF